LSDLRLSPHQRIWLALVALLLVTIAQRVFAEEGVLRVCQDPNNLPFSNLKGEGFENRIAQLFAEKLGWKLEYFSFPQRLGFIRNTLRFKLPGESYRCDLVMGVPAGYDQAAATRPYYRSTYALVYADGGKLKDVRTEQDFLALGNDKLKQLRIGLYDRSPASEWLAKHGLVEQGVPYRMLNADPNFSPGDILEKELVGRKVDVVIVWGPIAGFFAQRMSQPHLTVVPLASEEGVRLDYDIAMGVRFGEPEWKATVDRLIAENQSGIEQILREYGVPLLDADGKTKP